jgi:hypothetical protein
MKNVVLTVVLSVCSFVCFSQTKINDADPKLRFGFNIGTNYSNLQSKEILQNNAHINNGMGFRTGILMEYEFAKRFMFSPEVDISFYNCNVDFTNLNNTKSIYKIYPTALEVMTHFVYKIGNGKTRPYLLVGPNVKIPLNKIDKSEYDFITKPDCAIDFGIGLDNTTKYFIFAPEIRYSMGLLNINGCPALQSLNLHSISLVLNFK